MADPRRIGRTISAKDAVEHLDELLARFGGVTVGVQHLLDDGRAVVSATARPTRTMLIDDRARRLGWTWWPSVHTLDFREARRDDGDLVLIGRTGPDRDVVAVATITGMMFDEDRRDYDRWMRGVSDDELAAVHVALEEAMRGE